MAEAMGAVAATDDEAWHDQSFYTDDFDDDDEEGDAGTDGAPGSTLGRTPGSGRGEGGSSVYGRDVAKDRKMIKTIVSLRRNSFNNTSTHDGDAEEDEFAFIDRSSSFEVYPGGGRRDEEESDAPLTGSVDYNRKASVNTSTTSLPSTTQMRLSTGPSSARVTATTTTTSCADIAPSKPQRPVKQLPQITTTPTIPTGQADKSSINSGRQAVFADGRAYKNVNNGDAKETSHFEAKHAALEDDDEDAFVAALKSTITSTTASGQRSQEADPKRPSTQSVPKVSESKVTSSTVPTTTATTASAALTKAKSRDDYYDDDFELPDHTTTSTITAPQGSLIGKTNQAATPQPSARLTSGRRDESKDADIHTTNTTVTSATVNNDKSNTAKSHTATTTLPNHSEGDVSESSKRLIDLDRLKKVNTEKITSLKDLRRELLSDPTDDDGVNRRETEEKTSDNHAYTTTASATISARSSARDQSNPKRAVELTEIEEFDYTSTKSATSAASATTPSIPTTHSTNNTTNNADNKPRKLTLQELSEQITVSSDDLESDHQKIAHQSSYMTELDRRVKQRGKRYNLDEEDDGGDEATELDNKPRSTTTPAPTTTTNTASASKGQVKQPKYVASSVDEVEPFSFEDDNFPSPLPNSAHKQQSQGQPLNSNNSNTKSQYTTPNSSDNDHFGTGKGTLGSRRIDLSNTLSSTTTDRYSNERSQLSTPLTHLGGTDDEVQVDLEGSQSAASLSYSNYDDLEFSQSM